MDVRQLTPFLSVSSQISTTDVGLAASLGFKTIICNRPDQESYDQPDNNDIRTAAERHGLQWHYQPVISGKITDKDANTFRKLINECQGPALAYCRSGTRSTLLWALAEAPRLDAEAILKASLSAGYDLSTQHNRLKALNQPSQPTSSDVTKRHDVLILGGGAGGQAVAGSLLKRAPDLDIAIIEPRSEHYYQPGWTLVGGGVFNRGDTVRKMEDVMPEKAHWYHCAAAGFKPENQQVILEDGEAIHYRILVVAPGLALNWEAIPGLKDTLGHNGVTSNYLFDLAPYTWELVQSLQKGRAIFTQPPMPIKCAGAPQKAMYLSCDHWNRSGALANIDVEFHTAGAALFGVADYVPALMEYVKKYDINLKFQQNLIQVDGPSKTALFEVSDSEGKVSQIEKPFDMLHVCPPQRASKLISESQLADAAGWVDLNPETLQHNGYGDIFGLGDASSTPNAKTAAAIRKQAPVIAENVISALKGKPAKAIYDGYGSCPLTVERGKIILAEFGYAGKLQPSFPQWLVKGTEPTRLAWLLKEKMLPWLYWNAMLKGREWLAKPEILPHQPAQHEAAEACDFQEK